MTDIEKKALALVNEACKSGFKDLGITYRNNILDALLLAIEQHEAFRQEVSDAVEWVVNSTYMPAPSEHKLRRFIIAKPDPLVEAMVECGFGDSSNAADDIRAALAKRGFKIVEDV